MSLIFWDTNLFIYIVERHPDWGPKVKRLRRRMMRRRDRLCTSALTLGEVLAGPYSAGDEALANRYRAAFRAPAVETIPFTADSSEHYARIRTDRTISRTDAMQLACAAQARVDLFITTDRRLGTKHVPGVQFITGIENCPL